MAPSRELRAVIGPIARREHTIRRGVNRLSDGELSGSNFQRRDDLAGLEDLFDRGVINYQRHRILLSPSLVMRGPVREVPLSTFELTVGLPILLDSPYPRGGQKDSEMRPPLTAILARQTQLMSE